MKVKRTNVTREEYCARLMKRGWKEAGSACFATVYVKGKRAIKVVKLDFAYAAYARKVMRWGKKNKWFPKISSAHRFLCIPLLQAGKDRTESEYTVYSMERLVPLSQKEKENYDNGIRRRIFDHADNIKIPQLRVRRVLRMVGKHFGNDLHFNNVMRRESGHLVLSDPFYCFRRAPDRSVRL